jgi:hypothetical protein
LSEGKTHIVCKPATGVTAGALDLIFVSMAKIAKTVNIMAKKSISGSLAQFASAVTMKLEETSPPYYSFLKLRSNVGKVGKGKGQSRWADTSAPPCTHHPTACTRCHYLLARAVTVSLGHSSDVGPRFIPDVKTVPNSKKRTGDEGHKPAAAEFNKV